MPKITKPMLASAFDESKARFPYIATPKIDGIRFLMVDGQAVSRSFKPIRNKHIQKLLGETLPDGTDGELTCGDNFQTSTSGIMSFDGEPDFKVWVFDYVRPEREQILPFNMRLKDFYSAFPRCNEVTYQYAVLNGTAVSNTAELESFEMKCLEQGYEGVMLRDPAGTYKFGRSSVNEGLLLKLKRFEDGEAKVIGFEEKMSNQNPEERDAFGRMKRSSALSGLVASGTLGALLLERDDGLQFSCGSGLNDNDRAHIWANQNKHLGLYAKYKYFAHGVKDKPRHPIFLGFRHPDDIS